MSKNSPFLQRWLDQKIVGNSFIFYREVLSSNKLTIFPEFSGYQFSQKRIAFIDIL